MYRNGEFWASIARQPLLPDRDTITSNACIEAYSRSLTTSLVDEEGERIGHAELVRILSSSRMSYDV